MEFALLCVCFLPALESIEEARFRAAIRAVDIRNYRPDPRPSGTASYTRGEFLVVIERRTRKSADGGGRRCHLYADLNPYGHWSTFVYSPNKEKCAYFYACKDGVIILILRMKDERVLSIEEP